VASGGAPHPLTDDAVRALFEHGQGMPREANILADNALLLAYHTKRSRITDQIVQQVAADRREHLGQKEAP
jgi:type II secretory pathway predicted ATPase ExeA